MAKITKLKNGAQMPTVGLGTWKGEGVRAAVVSAIERGYRHLDCAADYGNEEDVGAGIKEAIEKGLCKREDLWITSKLWNTFHGEHAETGCRKSLKDLGLDYIDLYLIHFPIPLKFVPIETRYPPEWVHDPDTPELNKMIVEDIPYLETWAEMEKLVEKGLVKNIGVSNVNCQLMMEILRKCKIPPAVNQVEVHPHLMQSALVKFCTSKGIVMTGFSPLGASSYSWLDAGVQKKVLEEPVLKAIAETHKKSTAQVCIRWQVQRGLTVVPKSVNPDRQSQNMDVFDFTLSEDEMKQIAGLNKNLRYNDPGDFTRGMGDEWKENGYPIYG